MSSFIGTDNHAATAELRPPPVHNIKGHLATIASAIVTTDEWLRSSEKYKDVVLVAAPSVQNEPLGGHIHTSFFFNNTDYAKLLKMGLNLAGNSYTGTQWTQQPVPLPEMTDMNCHARLMEQVASKSLPTPYAFIEIMNYLLLPTEMWLQLWGSRLRRNNKYGKEVASQVRWNATHAPAIPKFAGWAFLHYEHRMPSTWLNHPWMAYIYFALAKLTALNWKLVSTTMSPASWKEAQMLDSAEPHNEDARRMLADRLHLLEKSGKLRWSYDLSHLKKALDYAKDHRAAWVDPYKGICVPAWKELLG